MDITIKVAEAEPGQYQATAGPLETIPTSNHPDAIRRLARLLERSEAMIEATEKIGQSELPSKEEAEAFAKALREQASQD